MPNTHSTLTSLFTDIANAIRAKKGTSADIVADNFPSEIASIPSGGITPSGKKLITDTSETDVAAFATAQISSDTLLAENIKKDVNILGVVGSFEGGGGGLPEGITAVATGTFTVASLSRNYTVTHGLGVIPKTFMVTAETPSGEWEYSLNQYTIYSIGIQTDYGRFTTPAGQINGTTNNMSRAFSPSVTITVNENDISFTTYSPRGGFQPSQIIDSEGTTEMITYRWYALG